MRRRAVIIGGGPNGLTAATALAQHGGRNAWDVTLVEGRANLGGLAAHREFHPGFFAPGPLADTSRFSPALAAELHLERHGLSFKGGQRGGLIAPGPAHPSIWIDPDDEAATTRSIAAICPADADAYRAFRGLIERLTPPVASLFNGPLPPAVPADPGDWLSLVGHAARLRRLSDRDIFELLRLIPLPVADWMDSTFETPALQAGLAHAGIVDTFLGPRSAGSSATLLLLATTSGASVEGGAGALLAALTAAASAAGANLRTDCAAAGIEVSAGRVSAVTLEDGTSLAADAVLLACHPGAGLLELISPRQLDSELAQAVQNHRSRGTAATLHLALDSLPAPFGQAAIAGAANVTRLRTSPSLEQLELSFNGIRYGELPESPALAVSAPSARGEVTATGEPLAPAGAALLSIHASFVPHDGWTAERRTALEATILKTLAPSIPDLAEHILASHLVTPADLEAEFNLPGGNPHHGEHALDQLLGLRPAPDLDRLPGGLLLASGGTHPGGGLTGIPGSLAASAASAAPRAKSSRA